MDWRLLVTLGVALYLAFAFAVPLALKPTVSDLDLFFWPAAELFAHGHPLLAYSVHAGPYPNANGPLSLLPLTVVALLANALGWASNLQLRDALATAAFSAFTLLAVWEALQLMATAGVTTRGGIAGATLALSVPLWIALGSFGHIEIPLEIWLSFLSLRLLLDGRPILSGAAAGLALLTRSACIVPVLALALMTFAYGGEQPASHRVRRLLAFLIASVAITAAGLTPFIAAEGTRVLDSLVTFRGTLPISGGSAWVLIARGFPWGGVIRNYDGFIFTFGAIIVVSVALYRWRRETIEAWRVSALLAAAACCIPLLSKTTWSYYLADPFAFAVLAAVTRPGPSGPRAWLAPVLLGLVSVMLAITGLSTPPTPAVVVTGVAASALIALAMMAVLGAWSASPGWAARMWKAG